MPYGGGVPARSWTGEPDGYASLVQQMHHSLYDLNVGTDFVFPDDAGLLRLQAADRPRALHRGRRAAAANLGLREKRRPRGDDLQERIRQRELRRPLGARARPAARGRRLQLSGVLQPRTSAGAQRRSVPCGRRTTRSSYWAEFLMPEHAKAARVLRPSLLRKMAGNHRKPIRLRHAAVRGNISLRRAANRHAQARA